MNPIHAKFSIKCKLSVPFQKCLGQKCFQFQSFEVLKYVYRLYRLSILNPKPEIFQNTNILSVIGSTQKVSDLKAFRISEFFTGNT
jgi:hypothetical protein